MIQQVAAALKSDFKHMRQFSSLSPIPNFTEYLLSTIQAIQRKDDSKNFISFWRDHTDFERLQRYVEHNPKFIAPKEEKSIDGAVFWPRIIHMIRSGEWVSDPVLVELLQQPLMRICAHYLHYEKRRGYALNSVGRCLVIGTIIKFICSLISNTTANFHLKNGAVMWRLNWLADISTRGLTSSCGIMINYRFVLLPLVFQL